MWHYDYEEKDSSWAIGVSFTEIAMEQYIQWAHRDGHLVPLNENRLEFT